MNVCAKNSSRDFEKKLGWIAEKNIAEKFLIIQLIWYLREIMAKREIDALFAFLCIDAHESADEVNSEFNWIYRLNKQFFGVCEILRWGKFIKLVN